MFKNGNRNTRKTSFIVFYDIALNIMIKVIPAFNVVVLMFFSDFESVVD